MCGFDKPLMVGRDPAVIVLRNKSPFAIANCNNSKYTKSFKNIDLHKKNNIYI